MKQTMSTIVSCLLGLILLTGCTANNIKRQEVSALEKGLSRQVVQAILKGGKPTGETALGKDGQAYVALRYNLVTGSEYQPVMICDKNGCFDAGGNADTTSHFVAVFRNEKLYTWGTFDELAKNEDPVVIEIVRQVKVVPEQKRGFGL